MEFISIQDVEFEKIFSAFKRLQHYGMEEIQQEFQCFKEVCKNCLTICTTPTSYSEHYKFYFRNEKRYDFPIIEGFFKSVKNYSQEAYDFLSEGHGMTNIKSYLLLEGKQIGEIIDVVIRMEHYEEFLHHAFMKIITEEDVNKKRIMLRGLVGI